MKIRLQTDERTGLNNPLAAGALRPRDPAMTCAVGVLAHWDIRRNSDEALHSFYRAPGDVPA